MVGNIFGSFLLILLMFVVYKYFKAREIDKRVAEESKEDLDTLDELKVEEAKMDLRDKIEQKRVELSSRNVNNKEIK